MNFRHIKKAVAVCVSFAMVISYIPYVLSASAEKSEPETGHTDELLGNYLLNEDFSATQVGSLPADWDKTNTYPGLNVNPGNATGLTDGNIAVAEDGGKYLKYNSAKGDHILTLPMLGTEDYEMSAELEYSDYESSDKTPTAVQTPIKITYDENDRSYESGGTSFQDYYTMVDGEYISRDGAAVTEYSNGNKAMKITALATKMNTYPANFTISDSNNGYKGFQPKANTNYKISFKYLVKKASGFDNINVELRLDKNGGKHFNYYNESSYIADTLLTIPANKTYGEWQTFEKEISISSIPQDAKEAYIAFSDGKSWSGGEWYRGEIEMWIDDFTVTAAAVSEINNTYDDGTLPQDFTKWGTAVAEYESGNNAVKISEYTTRSYDWPACFRILDSNNGNSNFTPIADTKYKISFKYRIDKANSSKPIAIELRYDKPGGNMSMSLDNLMTYGYLKDTLVNSAAGAVTDGWVSFEKEVTFSSMPDGANPVYLAVTTGLADWNGKEGAIEVGIDDVSVIPEVLENHIRGDLNDDKEVNVLDLIKIKKAATGIIEKGMAYDINGDCNVSDAGDIACLRKMILGIDVIHSVNLNGSVYNLVWNDEFNGTALDGSKWDDTRILMQSDGITQLSGEEAKENGTLKVGDGYLTLATKKSNGNYITTSINTYDTMQFQYGYAEIRAKFPYGVKGAWPSWWMTNAYSTINSGIDASLPYGVEFDIVEVMNGSNKNFPNIHKWYREVKDENNKVVRDTMQLVFSDSGNKIFNYTMPNDKVNDFHTYGFLWKENEIIFNIDGEVYNTLDITCKFGEKDTEDSNYINQPMDFIFTNWVSEAALSGKTFEGSELVVDYIRLYQNNECKIAK